MPSHSPAIPRERVAPPPRALPTGPQVSLLRYFRPDGPAQPPPLPMGSEEDRFAPWYQPAKPLLSPAVQTLPRRWELAFPSQLRDWRERSVRLLKMAPVAEHGMIAGQTWLFPVGIPEGEALQIDQAQDRNTIQPARQRLVMVCMPPYVVLREGDQIAVSDPRDRERPINASKMPQEVLTVPPGPRLMLAHELDSLAWAASEDREALVGELLADTPSGG